MLNRVLLVGAVMVALSGGAASQTAADPSRILARLDELEAENQKLQAEIQTLRSELRDLQSTAATASSGAGDASVAGDATSLSERVGVVESHTEELAQSKVEASQKQPVAFTGMLLFNAFLNGPYGGGSQDPLTARASASPVASGATFRQTVLGFRFHGPELPWGGRASGTIYMDFFGGSATPSNNLIRLRIATIDLTWKNTTITAGQDKPLIAPREPVSLAQVGISPLTSAGNLWAWQPQVRVEQRFRIGEGSGITAQAGVYQTAESYSSTLPQQFASSLEKARPGYEGRIEYFRERGRWRLEIAPGFHYSDTHVVGMSIPSRIGSVDWMLRPGRPLEFSGAWFHGTNVAGLGALPGFNVSASGLANAVGSSGVWGQMALFPAARLSFHAYAGTQWNNTADLGPGSISSNLIYAGNLLYKFAPNVVAALEASQVRTQYLNSAMRLNNHYDLALAYLF